MAIDNQEVIKSWVEHPAKHRKGTYGQLVRFRSTGIYVLRCGGRIIGVPQDWASRIAQGKE